MSSSNESSSGTARLRPARRCSATSTTCARKANGTSRKLVLQRAGQAKNKNGLAHSRAKVRGNQRLAASTRRRPTSRAGAHAPTAKSSGWLDCQSAMPPVAAAADRARVRNDCMARPTCSRQRRTWPKRSGLLRLRQISSSSAGENSASARALIAARQLAPSQAAAIQRSSTVKGNCQWFHWDGTFHRGPGTTLAIACGLAAGNSSS